MNTSDLTKKFKALLNRHRKKKLSAEELQQLNTDYQCQYARMTDKEASEAFVENVLKFMKHELSPNGYWNNPDSPQDYLKSLAQVGTFSTVVYNGFIPEEMEELFIKYLEKSLVQVFTLKNFRGFSLQLTRNGKATCVTSVKLVWNENHSITDLAQKVIARSRDDKSMIIERRMRAHSPSRTETSRVVLHSNSGKVEDHNKERNSRSDEKQRDVLEEIRDEMKKMKKELRKGRGRRRHYHKKYDSKLDELRQETIMMTDKYENDQMEKMRQELYGKKKSSMKKPQKKEQFKLNDLQQLTLSDYDDNNYDSSSGDQLYESSDDAMDAS